MMIFSIIGGGCEIHPGRSAFQGVLPADSIRFSLDTLAPFEWDQVLIVRPYAQIQQIEGLSDEMHFQLHKSGIRQNDGITILLFIRSGEMATLWEVPRMRVDFTQLIPRASDHLRLRRKSAIFDRIKERRSLGKGIDHQLRLVVN